MTTTAGGRIRRLKVANPYNSPSEPLLTIDALAIEWLDSCRARNLSPRTIGYYEFPIQSVFLPWVAGRGHTAPDSLTQAVVDSFAVELLSRPTSHRAGRTLARATVAGYMRPVRLFTDWLRGRGYELGRPQQISVRRPVIEILSRSEIQLLEDRAPTERDKLIIRLFADCGLRVGEMCRLNVTDLIEGDDGWWYLKVAGKGERPRWAPMPKWHPRLASYLKRGRPQCSTAAMFVSLRRNRVGEYDRLTESGVQAILHWVARAALPKRRVYPHLLRHSAITHYLSKGMNPYQVSQITGNFQTLDVYAHLKPQDAREGMLKALED